MPELVMMPEGTIEKTLFGVRRSGDAGWRIAEWACKPEELVEALKARRVTYEEHRIIRMAWSRPEFVGVLMADNAIRYGWLLDPATRLWHPPDEPLPPPDGAPVPVAELELSVRSIRFGCVHLALRAGLQQAELYCGDVDDPFPQLARWVRGVENGGEPHAVVMQGFDWGELHAFNTADPDTVRLLVRGEGRFGGLRIDALIAREVVTTGMRRLFRKRLFDVSSGFEDVWERGGEQVDDGDVGCRVAVAAGTGAGGLEESVEGFEASIGVR